MSWSRAVVADAPVGAVDAVVPGDEIEVLDEGPSTVEVALSRLVEQSPWGRFRSVFGGPDVGSAPVTEGVLLRRLADAEGLVTQLMGRQSADLLALRQCRLASQRESSPDGHEPDSCTRGCCDPDGWMGLEVAQTLAVTERQVDARLDTAQRLARFSRVREAVEDGLIQVWTATKLAEHLDELAGLLPADRVVAVEAATVAWLLDRPRTVGQLNARMRRLIVQARSEAGLDCPTRDARSRRVWVEAGGADGLATLVGRLPEPDALAVRAVLSALGEDAVGQDDGRTREQRRADLLTAMITGVPAAHGCPGDVDLIVRGLGSLAVQVSVTVPASTLTGCSASADVPGEVPGYGPVPAETARALVAGATSCRGLVYDPETGHLLGMSDLLRPVDSQPGTGRSPVGPATDRVRMRWLAGLQPAGGYSHPVVMERLVHARDGTCRAPGCARVAVRCDCDHVVPWPRGQTSAANTCCLCRRHHRLKTHAPGWQTAVDECGRLTWTTPTGATFSTEPHDYRDASPAALPDVVEARGPAGAAEADEIEGAAEGQQTARHGEGFAGDDPPGF